jgi:hypothetical protein
LILRHEEIMSTSESFHDLTNKEFSPLDLHIGRDSLVMFLLHAFKIIKFIWSLNDI